jgi:pimeloyl-ACP methyl ester carboxylesterase
MGNIFLEPGMAETSYREASIDREGCTIRYWRSGGNGPWLVLLHGAGVDHRMFNAQLPVLDQDHRVLLWDARGHGRSRPAKGRYSFATVCDDLLAVMDAESIASATLIGQSAGGNLAQEIALRAPQRVDGLVIIDSTYNLQRLGAVERFLVRHGTAVMAAFPWTWMMRQSARVSAVTPEAQAYIEESFAAIGKQGFITAFTALTDCLHEEPGRSLGKPILLIVGGRDGTGNIRAIADRWPEWEPGCRLVVLPEAGHGANMDAPAEVNRLILDFLGERHGR